jgi:hypothetical protein
MSEYANFRQQLDAVLRTRDVQKVRDFLVSQGQWSEGTPSDVTFAMWMMIAGSPTLQDLHREAQTWLISHGHEAEAAAVLGRGKRQEIPQSGKGRSLKKRASTKRGASK